MSSTERLPFTQWADIYRTERFISIQPKSGYRRALPENEGYVIYLPPDASDDVLGRSLVEALNRSRFIWPADEPEFFEWSRFTQCSRDWQNDFMKRYGYKTKRDAYKNMDWSGPKGPRGTYRSRRTSATSRSISETFRRIGPSLFRRPTTRLGSGRRCVLLWIVANSRSCLGASSARGDLWDGGDEQGARLTRQARRRLCVSRLQDCGHRSRAAGSLEQEGRLGIAPA